MNQDIYINVVGGLKLEGTSSDLGVAMAIYSSMQGIPLDSKDMLAIGEISLTGDLRPVSYMEKMAKEGCKMGFKSCVVPDKNKLRAGAIENLDMKGVKTLKEALELIR